MSALLKKPRKWVFDLAIIAPEWRRTVSRALILPMWESVGAPRFYSRGETEGISAVGTPIRAATPAGLGTAFTSTDYWTLDSGSAFDANHMGSALTMIAVWYQPDTTTWTGTFYNSRGTGQGINLGSLGNTRVRAVIEVNGGANIVPALSGVAAPEGIRVAALRWDGTNVELRADFMRDSPSTGSLSGTITASQFTPRIGNDSTSAAMVAPRRLLCMYFFSEWISDIEVFKFFDDPFGPFRMDDDVALFAPLGIVTISDYRFRQRFFG